MEPTSRADRPYQRTYKACIPCRQRKAKCDLGVGPDGLPIGPPCARCRREMRDCVFPEKRAWERSRKRAHSAEGTDDQSTPTDEATPDNAQKVATKRLNVQNHESPVRYSGPSPFQPDWTLDERQRSHQAIISPRQGEERNTHRESASPFAQHDNRNRSNSNLATSMMRTVVASGNDALNILFEAATAQSQEHEASQKSPLKGDFSSNQAQSQSSIEYEASMIREPVIRSVAPISLVKATQETLKIWARCRFVKMGWFTAREAVTFVDLFFKNMSCLSPILTDFYADHKNHYWLISREPVLCSTILMISSRYHILPSAGGESRNFFIHHRLWQHCQQMTTRLLFGQEKSTKSKVRSLGTVEALLLMAEWHPRSLHFPPEADGWDDDLISTDTGPSDSTEANETSANRWLEDVIEPSRRSDQMSWMLLGCGLSLAHELGIFETEENDSPDEPSQLNEQMTLRRQRVQRLLYVYINQLAWRIGCMSPIPQSLNHAVLGGRKPRGLSQPGSTWLVFMDSWIELTKLAQSVTDMFFPSAKFARQQLHSGRYVGLLEHFRPLLNQWKEKYLQPQLLDNIFYNDLFIEYHFVRVYTHSVGMQAVVERAAADVDSNMDDVQLMNIDPTDYEYIQEVIDGCCKILQKVTQLADLGLLRFSPVRIILRITSASIFLMKALSLGTRETTFRESLEILEKSIVALRSNALDDVHLSTRYATLLEIHLSRMQRNLLVSSKSTKTHEYQRTSMGPPPWPDTTNRLNQINTPISQDVSSDLGFMSSVNQNSDDWLALPFDPSMAPFGMSNSGQFPMGEGGALDFIWNLPS